MPRIQILDPALCCSSGVCGTDVDQSLVTIVADASASRLTAAATTSPLLQQRAANERARIEDVAAVHASRYSAAAGSSSLRSRSAESRSVVGLQPLEPVGADRLAALAEAQPSSIMA